MKTNDDIFDELASWCDSMRQAIELSIKAQAQITQQLKTALSSWEIIRAHVLTELEKKPKR